MNSCIGPAPVTEQPVVILREPTTHDVVVVGAGFGGLGAAVRLAESGADVLLCEALSYPGGCASTFRRGGLDYEAGATLFSGFGPGQLFQDWIERYGIDVEIERMDPIAQFRTPHRALTIPASRAAFLDNLCALPDAPRSRLRRFFHEQGRVADVLWSTLDAPDTLPPLSWSAVRHHLPRLPRYLGLWPHLGRSLADVLRRHDLQDFTPLRDYLNALCQITVQCSVDEADALFALGTMDYFFRGTAHVRGGIGRLAEGLLQVIRDLGGTVHLSDPVQEISSHGDGWKVRTRRSEVIARQVVFNTLTHDARQLLDLPAGSDDVLRAPDLDVRSSWGACMLYLELDAPELGETPRHLDLTADPTQPMVEGNHVFCSCGDLQGPDGRRTLTVSTHVPMNRYLSLEQREQGDYVRSIQERMRSTFDKLAPEWSNRVVDGMTASPRTFERFTRRHDGFVGGTARRSGTFSPLSIFESTSSGGLHLVGDSFFPGQSILATAIGGTRTAERVTRAL